MLRYYVSPIGDDDWSGTTAEPTDNGDGPFRHIDRAVEAVEDDRARDEHGDIEIVLRAGAYERESPIRITPAACSESGGELRIRNYPGEQPRVLGGVYLEEWREHEEEIQVADLPSGISPSLLYEDGTPAETARFPDDEYLQVDKMVDKTPDSCFGFDRGDVPAVSIDDLQIYVWPGGTTGEWSWFSQILDVESIDRDERLVTLANSARYPLGAGSRYYFRGPLDLLSRPGEFAVDTESEAVYYWPRDGPIGKKSVLVSTVTEVFQLEGAPGTPVQDVTIEGLEVWGADATSELRNLTDAETQRGAIAARFATDVTIERTHIHDVGLHGVLLGIGVQRATIRGNHVHDVGYTGVLIGDTEETTTPRHRSNVVTNNHVHHTGTIVGNGAGAQIRWNSAGNEISHNRIHHTSRYAISLKAPRAHSIIGDERDGIEITSDIAHDFIQTRHNVIASNDCSHANLDSQDTGVIESWGGGPGNTVQHNRLHDSEIPFSFGFGLYLDDEADGFFVRENLIHDLGEGEEGRLRYGIYSKGVRNRFYNNVVADTDAERAYGSNESFDGPTGEHTIHRNVFADTGGDVYGFTNWDEERYAYADENLFYDPDGEYGVAGLPEQYAYEGDSLDVSTLDEWRDTFGHDGDSVTADPGFLAPENDDYRFGHDSPALDLGIHSLDIASMGLTEAFPFADDTEAIGEAFLYPAEEDPSVGFVRVEEGEAVQLVVAARTETGFVLESSALDVQFTTDGSVAAVNDDGLVTGHETGVATVEADVSANGATVPARFQLVVE